MIEITSAQIERVNLLLGNIKGGAEKALSGAIERGKTTVRREATTQMAEVYAITKKNIRSETTINMKTQKGDGGIVGTVRFAGYKIPLFRFDVSPSQPKREVVKARVLQSGSKTPFEDAFIAVVKAGAKKYHTGIFQRDTGKRLPISQFYGPSTAQMANNSVVHVEVEKAAQETVNKRIEQEISRILNGYGGGER